MTATFGEYIKQRRTKLGFTLKKVASHLDIDTSTLGKIEREERNLSENLLTPLAEILETEQREILNHYYSSKVTQEIKGYPHYKEVLNIVEEQLKLYFSKTEHKQNWTEKEFQNPKAKIKVATMFSGIGAIEHAFKRLKLDSEIVFASDIDKYVKQSYFANYKIEEEDWYDNVQDINGNKYKGKVDLLVGGSPCQSFSMIGKRKGFADTRGTLFYDFARVVKESQPKIFIFENVKGLINHDKGNTFETIKATFDELGYRCFSQVLKPI